MGRISRAKDKLLQTPKERDDGPQGNSRASSPSATVATGVSLTLPTSTLGFGLASFPWTATTTIQSPPDQIAPCVPQSLSPIVASAALSTPPAVSNTAEPSGLNVETFAPNAASVTLSTQHAISSTAESSGPDVNIWSQAYGLVQERERELMEDYKKHMASLQGDVTVYNELLTPSFVEHTMKRLLEDREKKQWQVSLLGKDIKIREQAEKLAKFLVWSDSIVKTALSTQPYAVLAWSGVSLFLPLLTSGTTQNEAMLKGFNLIGELQMYWRICEETYLQSEHRNHYQDLTEPLVELYSYVIEYQARAICHLSRAQLSRAWQNVAGKSDWNANAKDISDRSQRCQECIRPLEKREIEERWKCQLQEMQQSRTVLEGIRRAIEDDGNRSQKNYKDEIERRLLQDLASDYEGYREFNPKRVEGTCEWFFNDDRFHHWRDSSTSNLLWVSAGPGCGKSVLSRALIDEHRLSMNITTSTICHFFFKEGDERRMHSTDALCAILHQLFTKDYSGTLIENALGSHKNHGNKLAQNFSELWQILVACARSPDTGEVVCILDALDECEKNSREQLIGMLKEFYCGWHSVSESKLKFLITSRPYDDLEAYFSKFSATNYLRFDGDDKAGDIGLEIDLVIVHRVNDIAGHLTPDHRDKLCNRLKSMENRTYLWLYLIFDTIKESLSRYSKLSSIETLLSEIPSRVSEAYEKILSRSQDEVQTELLLRIVLGAVHPLTLDEANIALTLAIKKERFYSHKELESDLWPKEDFKSIVKNLCGLFISVYDSKLFFIHLTAREFLLSPEGQGKWEGRLDMTRSHSTMSLVCIHYLLLPDFSEDQEPLDDQKSSFLSYAAAQWPLHYRAQEDAIADQSLKDARILCDPVGKQTKIWTDKRYELRKEHTASTDLIMASFLGLIPIVKEILIEGKTYIDALGEKLGTALQAASSGGHERIIQMLLDKDADVNIEGRDYGTALQAASSGGHKRIFQMLLDNGADVNMQDAHGSALQEASNNGHEDIVQMLLSYGATDNSALKPEE